jgi:hypothetical protein
MSTAMSWNASNSREVRAATRSKWGALRLGLVLAVLGDVLFLGLATLGLTLVGPAGASLVARLGLEGTQDAVDLGWIVICAGALPAYGLGLLGRWSCLVSSTQAHGAKDLQFACLLCSILAPGCFVAAHFLGGQATYEALERGLGGLTGLDPLNKGVILQSVGVLVFLLGVALFGASARALRMCLNGPEDAARLSAAQWLLWFLVGGTVGVFLQPHAGLRQAMLPVLAFSWLVCLAWHGLFILGTGRQIARVLRQRQSRVVPAAPAEEVEAGAVPLRSAAYFRRRA